jgi:cytoskeletal protein RodZ
MALASMWIIASLITIFFLTNVIQPPPDLQPLLTTKAITDHYISKKIWVPSSSSSSSSNSKPAATNVANATNVDGIVGGSLPTPTRAASVPATADPTTPAESGETAAPAPSPEASPPENGTPPEEPSPTPPSEGEAPPGEGDQPQPPPDEGDGSMGRRKRRSNTAKKTERLGKRAGDNSDSQPLMLTAAPMLLGFNMLFLVSPLL